MYIKVVGYEDRKRGFSRGLITVGRELYIIHRILALHFYYYWKCDFPMTLVRSLVSHIFHFVSNIIQQLQVRSSRPSRVFQVRHECFLSLPLMVGARGWRSWGAPILSIWARYPSLAFTIFKYIHKNASFGHCLNTLSFKLKTSAPINAVEVKLEFMTDQQSNRHTIWGFIGKFHFQ